MVSDLVFCLTHAVFASETFKSQWRRIRLKGLTKYTIIMTEAYQGGIKH